MRVFFFSRTHFIQLFVYVAINEQKKVESGMGCPDWNTAMQSSATKTSVDLLC